MSPPSSSGGPTEGVADRPGAQTERGADRPGTDTEPIPAKLTPSGGRTTRGPQGTTVTPAAGGGTAAARPARRARLAVRRVDPWSVLKFTLMYSVCLLIIIVVAVAALYAVLASMGVFDSINRAIRDLTDSSGAAGGTGGLQVVFSAQRIIGGAAVIGAINVVLVTALATLGAFLYNVCAELVGGIEVTLGEQD